MDSNQLLYFSFGIITASLLIGLFTFVAVNIRAERTPYTMERTYAR